MKVGDWVYSYSKGIWQITRIDEIESVLPDRSRQIAVQSKRFLNSSYKKSFASEICSPGYIKKLPVKEIGKVNEIILSKPNWYKDFQNFKKDVNTILNLSLYVSDKKQREIYKKSIAKNFVGLAEGLTDVQILEILKKELQSNSLSTIRNFTAQFISENSEVRNKKLLYTKLNFLDF